MQVCPLSALLFIQGIEPLVQAMRRNTQTKTNRKFKLSAYADNITVFPKTVCIKQVLDKLKILSTHLDLSSIHKNKVLMTRVNDQEQRWMN